MEPPCFSRRFEIPSSSSASRHTFARLPSRRSCTRLKQRVVTCVITRERDKQAILCQRLKAHDKALTTSLVLKVNGKADSFLTASLDKSMALWKVENHCEEPFSCDTGAVHELVRLVPSGSPIFSLLEDDCTVECKQQVFCGSMGREILAWEPGDQAVQETVVLDGHSGWVRSLAQYKKWLFSCSCSTLRQWDMSRAVPSPVRSLTVDKGDVLCLCTGSNKLFAATTDGCIRSWEVTKNGDLVESAKRDRAHMGRVTDLKWHRNFLYSSSFDGSVKMWDADTLELVMEVPKAHGGERIYCMAIASNGYLFTGGDDKLLRRWNVGLLTPAEPLYCHNYSVRTLSAAQGDLVVSGDAGGEVAVWIV